MSWYANFFFLNYNFNWWFSLFFQIINFCQCLFTLTILFDQVDRWLGHKNRKKILLGTIYISHRWLVVKLVENKYCKYMCKKDDRPPHQKIKRVSFYWKQRSRFVFIPLTFQKNPKTFTTECIPDVRFIIP